jgi:hypothetical protein
MKFIFIIALLLFTLVSCKDKTKALSEDFQAICFVSNGDEISLGNGVYMNSPTIHYVLFLYHDSLFQMEMEQKKERYCLLKCSSKTKDSLTALLKSYEQISLKDQLKKGLRRSCGPTSYFLKESPRKKNFVHFDYMDYVDWRMHNRIKEIDLEKNSFPRIYSTIYHTLNSKKWDYLMSDDYYYKEVRTYCKIEFIQNNTSN